jgi:hypothetical protein
MPVGDRRGNEYDSAFEIAAGADSLQAIRAAIGPAQPPPQPKPPIQPQPEPPGPKPAPPPVSLAAFQFDSLANLAASCSENSHSSS